jgi:hypothetical protein
MRITEKIAKIFSIIPYTESCNLGNARVTKDFDCFACGTNERAQLW